MSKAKPGKPCKPKPKTFMHASNDIPASAYENPLVFQVSTDGGVTWTDIEPKPKGE